MISTIDIAWLAGLLEGEGSFINCYTNDRKNRQFKISIGTTDKDVLLKASILLCSTPRIHSNGNGVRDGYARKILYDTTVHGSLAIQWMMTIYPLMGERRKAKIKEIIAEWRLYNPQGRHTRFVRGPYKKRGENSVMPKKRLKMPKTSTYFR